MLGWLILHAAIGVVGTWLARRYALQRDLLDHPSERRSHVVATPRGGGMAILAALLVATLSLAWKDPSQRQLLLALSASIALVAGVGLLDDHRPLSPWSRLAVHVVASGIFAATAFVVFSDPWVGLIALVSTLVLTNVWNFMDGINGIASSQALLLSVALGLALGGTWGMVAVALAAASAGFLPYNFPRARIFLGDGGSGAIGFAIAALATTAVGVGGLKSGWLLLPLSAFLVDAGLTLIRRVVRGERWWTPHVQHAYQVWARRGGHAVVTLAYAAWTAAGMLVMFAAAGLPESWLLPVCVLWYASAVLAWWWLQRADHRAVRHLQG